MKLELPHVLRVCQSCRTQGERRDGSHPGARFVVEVQRLYAHWAQRDRVVLLPTNCLTQCDEPCAAALSGPGKVAPTFVGLAPTAEDAAALLEYSEAFLASEDGRVAEPQCPARLVGHVALVGRR